MGSKDLKNKVMNDLMELSNFPGTSEFNSAFAIIKNHPESIDQEKMKYDQQVIEGLSCEDFSKVCNSLSIKYQDQWIRDNPESLEIMARIRFDYKGVRFYSQMGQGSNFWTENL